MMITVADCLRQHAPAYLAKFGDAIPAGHRKVLAAITRCRTGELGGVLYQCRDCRREHWVGRSCGNRHCPTCGHDKTARWLDKQARRLLPVHHFLVTFTVPDQVRSALRRSQRCGYGALFDAGSQTIVALAARSKYLGGCRIGFFGVLHTWGRDPCVYHPHVHFVVPGGGASEDRSAWQQTPANFLFPHAAAVTIYKAKLAEQLRACGLYDAVPTEAWEARFVVDIQPVGDGQAVLKYLAPYVNRVAISDRRMVACDDASVTFRYTPSGTRRSKTRTVPGTEFVRGFVQHTLPRGFQKVRYYGWMSPHSRIGLDEVKWLVWLLLGWTFHLASGHAPQAAPAELGAVRCAECGGKMQIVAIFSAAWGVLPEHAIAYLDSG
jgi:Putative transposase/Transposase zinc-binding domain